MKSVIISQVKVYQKASPHHLQTVDIQISGDGVITSISPSKSLTSEVETLRWEDACVSPAWMDARVQYGDPGFEQKEDIQSGSLASLHGGFAHVLVHPDTHPELNNKSQVEYVLNKAKKSAINVHVAASLFGNEKDNSALVEMHDVKKAGAEAISTGKRLIKDDSFLLNALQYATHVGLPIIIQPIHYTIGAKGRMSEGDIHVQLGLKGIPAIGEMLEVIKLITLSEYTGAKVHISGITSETVLPIIQSAKDKGLPITCEVYTHHLTFDDSALLGFDTNYKFFNPLRTSADRDALRKAVLSGLIDIVSSNHCPHEEDVKNCEFELADYDSSGTQTVFNQLISALGTDSMVEWLPSIHTRPKQLYGIEEGIIKEGSKMDLTFFSTSKPWILDASTNKSKSKNHPLFNTNFTGKPLAVLSKGKLHII